MSRELSAAQISQMADQAVEWLCSDEGRAELDQALQEAEESAAKFRQAREVDYATLHTPFTI